MRPGPAYRTAFCFTSFGLVHIKNVQGDVIKKNRKEKEMKKANRKRREKRKCRLKIKRKGEEERKKKKEKKKKSKRKKKEKMGYWRSGRLRQSGGERR